MTLGQLAAGLRRADPAATGGAGREAGILGYLLASLPRAVIGGTGGAGKGTGVGVWFGVSVHLGPPSGLATGPFWIHEHYSELV
jgi:hypothetical protein